MPPQTSPGFMYHKNRPEGQLYPDLPTVQAMLEAEGWVDNPGKLNPDYVAPPPTPLPPLAAATEALKASEGRVLNLQEQLEAPLTRMGKIVNADGDLVHEAMEDSDLISTIDDMGREEIVQLAGKLGVEAPEGDYASEIRSALIEMLRPELDVRAVIFGVPQPDDGDAENDAATMAKSVGSGTTTTAELKQDGPTVKEFVEAGYQAKNYPPSGYASRSTDEEVAEAIKAQVTTEPADPAIVPLDALKAMGEDEREALIEKATNDTLRAWLADLGKTAKARDGKEELQESLRAALAPQE